MIILIIHIIVSYDQNISLIFLCEKWIPHVRLWHPSCVYITVQRQYTAVQKMCTLLKLLSLHYTSLTCTISLYTQSVRSLNRPIRTFCKHMTSPTVALRSKVKHDPSQWEQIEIIVKLDYVLTPILWVTSGGQTL